MQGVDPVKSTVQCTPLTFGFKPRPEKGYSAN